ncbi:MAG: Ca2+-dependent phosphoinositide-specific phospholipase C [Polyangiales bacterium]
MRHTLVAAVLLAACHSDPASTTSDSGADAADDEDAVVCPPALGTAKARTVKPTAGPLDDVIHVNEIELKATHNSYHQKPVGGAIDWQYQHAPLATQLSDLGVRGLELDLHWNDACGRYEVYHLPMFDEGTSCRVFTDCLQIIRTWSDAHPSHHLLFLHIEPKDGYDPDTGEKLFLAMETEILSVFTRDLLVTPDDVKGTSTTLKEAVTTKGWPTLGATRGKVLFYLDRSDSYRDAYAHGRKDLDKRLLFADADEADPFAAVLVRNDALGDKDAITALVKKGFIVRTFADKSIAASLAGDRSQLEAALVNGAQIVSTDFPAKIPETTYFVEIPGGMPSRCNPVTATASCDTAAIEPK